MAKVLAEGKPSFGGFYWQKVEKSNGFMQYICRKTTAEEAAAAHQQRRQIELREQAEAEQRAKQNRAAAKAAEIDRLKSLERSAQRRVINGYNPDVSIQEFQRHLDRRSDIQASIRDLQYGQ